MSDANGVRRRVRLLRVPTDVLVRHRRHLDDLVHELHILKAGAVSDETRAGARLGTLVSEILDAHATARHAVWHQTEKALTTGRDVVDIDVDLPSETAMSAPHLLELLEQADRMCRDLQLLTMAASPDVAELRRWVSGQIVAQVGRGEEPQPYPR